METIKTTAKVLDFGYAEFGNDLVRKAKLDCAVKRMRLTFGVPELIDDNFIVDYHGKLNKGDIIAITQTIVEEGDLFGGITWERQGVITSFEIL